MRHLRLDRFRTYLLLGFLVVTGISLVHPPYPKLILLQHIPTVLALVGIFFWSAYCVPSRAAFTCVFAFLVLHVLGARYIYSFVPYDDWLFTLSGVRLSETMGFARNHYDRFVHVCFGLLLFFPLWETFRRTWRFSRRQAWMAAVVTIMAVSMCYEIFEWIVAMTFSPDAAEAYNGQQGDMWDAQKDMLLATLGAVAGGVFLWKVLHTR